MFDTSYFEKVSLKGLLKGAIDYEEDQEGDLAEVEDQEDRALLHAAEKEVKESRDEDQEELEVDMLPGLFRYGLKMLENNEIAADYHQENSESEDRMISENEDEEISEKNQDFSDEEEPQKERKKEERLAPGKRTREQALKGEVPDQEQQQQEQSSSVEVVREETVCEKSICTFEKLKAMAIYQNHYLFMKKHVYEAEEEEKVEEEVKEPKRVVDKRKRRRKR